jgi:hypothetical protein
MDDRQTADVDSSKVAATLGGSGLPDVDVAMRKAAAPVPARPTNVYDKRAADEKALGAKFISQMEGLDKNPSTAIPDTHYESFKEKMPEPDPVRAFGSWASLFGIVMGASTKAPLTSALNASASAMKASRDWDLRKYQDAKDRFQIDMEVMEKNSKAQMERRNAYMNMFKTNMDVANAMAQADSAAEKDKLNDWKTREEVHAASTRLALESQRQKFEMMKYQKEQYAHLGYVDAAVTEKMNELAPGMPDGPEKDKLREQLKKTQGNWVEMRANQLEQKWDADLKAAASSRGAKAAVAQAKGDWLEAQAARLGISPGDPGFEEKMAPYMKWAEERWGKGTEIELKAEVSKDVNRAKALSSQETRVLIESMKTQSKMAVQAAIDRRADKHEIAAAQRQDKALELGWATYDRLSEKDKEALAFNKDKFQEHIREFGEHELGLAERAEQAADLRKQGLGILAQRLELSIKKDREGEAAAQAMSQEEKMFYAKRVQLDPHAMPNLGNGVFASRIKTEIAGMAAHLSIEQNISPAMVNANQNAYQGTEKAVQKLEGIKAGTELFEQKYIYQMEILEGLLKKGIGASGPKFLNTPVNQLKGQLGDAGYAALEQAVNTIVGDASRAVSGGTLSIAQTHAGVLDETRKMINTDVPVSALKAKLDIIKQEIGATRRAQASVENKYNAIIGGKETPPPQARIDAAQIGDKILNKATGTMWLKDVDGIRPLLPGE